MGQNISTLLVTSNIFQFLLLTFQILLLTFSSYSYRENNAIVEVEGYKIDLDLKSEFIKGLTLLYYGSRHSKNSVSFNMCICKQNAVNTKVNTVVLPHRV